MPQRKPPRKPFSPLLLVVAAAIVLGVVFGGTYVIRSLTGSNNNNPSSGNGSQCAVGPCQTSAEGSTQSPVRGTVTAFSATSITIQPADGGRTETFTVTDTTQVINANGGPANYGTYGPGNLGDYKVNDIHNGDTVAIVPSNSDLNQAQRIILNPPNGGNGS